ncbi:MAG TPA: DMT family protein [Nitrospiraceae bacterium]|nr:DMT family protein [Nitrospiraceae bacterium]
MQTVALLTISNVFMTMAWHGHLKFKEYPLLTVIFVSWGIAFVEYCFQVPANRIGHAQFTAAQLKTIQEVITLVVFSVFSVVYLKEALK